MRKERWQAGLIQGGENTVVCDFGQLLIPQETEQTIVGRLEESNGLP